MPQNAQTTWQFALQLALLALVIVGFIRLVRSRRSSSRGFAVAVIIMGLVGLTLKGKLVKPSWHRQPGDNAETTRPAELSDRLFDSNDLPAVKLEAPDGWRIEFDSVTGAVAAMSGGDTIASASTVFQVNSSRLSDDVDLARVLELASTAWEARGMTRGDTFAETIDGLPASGRVMHGETDDSCLWFVKRGPKFVSALVCRSRSPTNARQACSSVLERLSWRDLARR